MSTNLEQQARALIRADNFISGQWLAAASGRRFAVTDPATGKLIADVADSGPRMRVWRRTPPPRRYRHGVRCYPRNALPYCTAGMPSSSSSKSRLPR